MSKVLKLSVKQTMAWVIGATLPALALLTYWQGPKFLLNLGIAVIAGFALEGICLKWRKMNWNYLLDGSTLLTAILFVVGVPAFASPWVLIVGMFFAIVIAKHVYGGLGHNIFNPAMVAYAVALIAFPTEMVVWPTWSVDSMSAATPLDHANSSIHDHVLFPYYFFQIRLSSSVWVQP